MDNPAPVNHPIHPLLQNRWSPRAFSAQPLSDGQLDSLLEAARWAASSGNRQPWRLVVARRGSPAHQAMAATLTGANPEWAPQAAALIAVLADPEPGSRHPNRHAWYDAGQAMANLAIQATALGLFVHQMGGFDGPALRQALAVPEGIELIAVAAVGHGGDPAALNETLRQREAAPRTRHPIEQWVFEGKWGTPRKSHQPG